MRDAKEICQEAEITNYQKFLVWKHNVSKYYKHVNTSNLPSKVALRKWNIHVDSNLEMSEFDCLFKYIRLVTVNVKLRSFQYRILHSALVLNTHLFRWGIKQNNRCTFCSTNKEMIRHLFWECSVTKQLWQNLWVYCKKISSSEMADFTFEKVMMNLVNAKPNHIFNFFVLIVKEYVYVMKCLGKTPAFETIKYRIERNRSYELYYAKANDKVRKHCDKWLIQKANKTMYNGTGLTDEFIQRYVIDM